MEIESVKCDCCGLREDCTREYITNVQATFNGKWLCGLCSEAVQDEAGRAGQRKKAHGPLEEALRAHMAFCRKTKLSPAGCVADGMRQMLRRRSGKDPATPAGATSS